jgi:hypothetical protein
MINSVLNIHLGRLTYICLRGRLLKCQAQVGDPVNQEAKGIAEERHFWLCGRCHLLANLFL